MGTTRTYLPAFGLLAFSLAWTGGLTAQPRDGEAVAAFYPLPFGGDGAFRQVVAAGASAVLAVGATPTLIVARSGDPAFIDNLYASGALVVIRAPSKADCLR